jgi:hypothetical protein
MAGLIFVALFVASGVIFGDPPGSGATDETILSYYRDDGNQLKLEIALLLATAAALFFIWFVGWLSAALRQAEGEPAWLSRVALISGGAFAAVMVVGAATYQFASDSVDDNPDRFQLDANLARLLNNAAYTLTSETAFPVAAPLALATSFVSLRTAFLPRWLGWLGVAASVGCVLGFVGGGGVFLIWIALLSVYLLFKVDTRFAIRSPGSADEVVSPSGGGGI